MIFRSLENHFPTIATYDLVPTYFVRWDHGRILGIIPRFYAWHWRECSCQGIKWDAAWHFEFATIVIPINIWVMNVKRWHVKWGGTLGGGIAFIAHTLCYLRWDSYPIHHFCSAPLLLSKNFLPLKPSLSIWLLTFL